MAYIFIFTESGSPHTPSPIENLEFHWVLLNGYKWKPPESGLEPPPSPYHNQHTFTFHIQHTCWQSKPHRGGAKIQKEETFPVTEQTSSQSSIDTTIRKCYRI